MKLSLRNLVIVAILLCLPLAVQAKASVKNGSFEKATRWECSGCDSLGVNLSWLFATNNSTPYGTRAAYLVPNVSIAQSVKVPQKQPAVGLAFAYNNTGSFQVQITDEDSGEEYVNSIVDSFTSSFTEKSYTLPGRARGRQVRITFKGLQYTTYLDHVQIKKLAYPIASFQIETDSGKPLKKAKVWFERNGKVLTFKVLNTKQVARSIETTSSGKTGKLRVLAPPKKTKICAKKAVQNQCSKLYDIDSFDFGTNATAMVTLNVFE